jgi:hypothetical protein
MELIGFSQHNMDFKPRRELKAAGKNFSGQIMAITPKTNPIMAIHSISHMSLMQCPKESFHLFDM